MKPVKILCCGEALIDMLPVGETFRPVTGGGSFNTAIALGRLGLPVGLFSGISSDFFGDMLRDGLKQSGVEAGFVSYSDRPSTLAFVRLQDGQAHYAFHDENTAGRMLGLADLPALPASVRALVFGGISLATEPCASTYEALMMRARAAKLIMVDPNIRPALISEQTAYRARIERMLAMADIVKLSDEDLHWLRGAADLDAVAQSFIAKGAKLVLITHGAKGATAYTAETQVFAPAIATKVVDTIGAGDTFNAGLLAALHQGSMLDKQALATLPKTALKGAVGYANRVAAISVSRAGANPPWAKEMT